MLGSLELKLEHKKEDSSVALFINGDLQFDSTDEHIYHESLVLPALTVAIRRIDLPLKVLVIGGGDGLVARELFKSSCVASLDLVDYDPRIIALAGSELAKINNASMSDPRLTLHVQDAWHFVDQALTRCDRFDLVVSDLTVAEDVSGARFHSVDWYGKLASLLSGGGVLTVNGVSPQATPEAFWSIFNSMLKAGLTARPYHVTIPSFSALGYGEDWGFLLASVDPIAAEELNIDLLPAGTRRFLLNNDALRRLFILSDELFAYQNQSLPALAGSDILLHYFRNTNGLDINSEAVRDAFSMDISTVCVPATDSGKNILPPELSAILAKSININEGNDTAQREDITLFLHEILDLMPSLQREQTSELVADFLEEPSAFLQALDLPALVSRLLGRAAELPSQLVAELEHLREKVAEWAGDELSLLTLGRRVITILTLAIVLGNLFYPDMAYGKGSHTGGHDAHHAGIAERHGASGHRARGRRGGWVGGGWGNGYYVDDQIVRRKVVPKGPIGPGPNQAVEKQLLKNSLPQPNDVSNAEYIDENGTAYPARRFHIVHTPGTAAAAYRLGPRADILANGCLAVPLTERSYLLVTPQSTQVIEQQSGLCIMQLHNDPALLNLTIAEINRQHARLSSTGQEILQTPSAQAAISSLSKAKELFGKVAPDMVPAGAPLAPGGIEVFPSVWVTGDGKYLAVKRHDGQVVYLDGTGCYSDCGLTPLAEPYPAQFRSIAASCLEKIVGDVTATRNMLQADCDELAAHANILGSELAGYESSKEVAVNFGSRKVSAEEAIRLTQLNIVKTKRQIQALMREIEELPANIDLARIALTHISKLRNA